jgi:hypothetical protein
VVASLLRAAVESRNPENHVARQLSNASQVGCGLRSDGFVIADLVADSTGGVPVRPDRLTQAFKRITDRVPGASEVRLHDLRHWSATMQLDAGESLPADVLDVSPRRVRQLLESGQLAGEQLGRNWVIDRGDVDRLRRSGAGRPWNASSAWAVLELAAGRKPELSPVERSRARRRLADHGLAGLVVQLRARAERHEGYVHPSVLDRVGGDDRVVRGGVSAAREYRVDLIIQDAAEVYVRAGDVADLADSYALDGDADRPNVILHVVDDNAWPFDDDEQIASWAVVAVDLLDADDERSRRAGLELIERQR